MPASTLKVAHKKDGGAYRVSDFVTAFGGGEHEMYKTGDIYKAGREYAEGLPEGTYTILVKTISDELFLYRYKVEAVTTVDVRAIS